MLVGEMRDPDSLAIGIQAGLTGHLVLSTLHTNNAVETIGRMVDMNAEQYLIAGVIVAILATIATLALGIGSMIYHGEAGPFDSEHWMRYRVVLQVVTLLALLATFVVSA